MNNMPSAMSLGKGLCYNRDMKVDRGLEPGVLRTFRLFIGVQFALSTFGAIAHMFVPLQSATEVMEYLRVIGSWFTLIGSGSEMVTPFTVLALESGLLFLYLSISSLPRRLGSFYLPLGIVWASAWPILEPYLEVHAAGNNVQVAFVQIVLWQQIILLFIPLVVISWQYSMHQVVWFCGLTTALNIALLSQTAAFREAIASSVLGIVLIEIIAFLLVGNMIVNLMQVQREQRQRLIEANQRLAQQASTLEQLTISRERNRLAQELHDVLAHTLSGVAIELEGLRAMLRVDPDRANALLAHSLQAVREGLSETRRALQELRAKPLEDLGLALAVRALAESYASRVDLRMQLKVDGDVGDYPAEVQQCVYRIAQEALANVAEHAQAQNVQVVLTRDRKQLKLIVQDDGCGFDPGISGGANSFGLLGMRERAAMIGGSLSVESQVGKGTRIAFSYRGNQ